MAHPMKPSFIFISGLAIGILCGWAGAMKSAPARAGAEPNTAVAVRPAPSTSMAANHAPPLSGPTELKAERPSRPGLAPKAKVFQLGGGESTPEMQEINEKIRKQMEDKKTRKIDERLAALRSRLGLTDEQAAKVRALLDAKNPDAPAVAISGDVGPLNVEDLISGGTPTKAQRETTDTKIAGLLTPDQQEKFQSFQQEQRDNRVEIATNREMTGLQKSLTLTPEQKDQAYQALGQLAQQDEDQAGSDSFDPAVLAARKKARIDALHPILTPEQMRAYEAQPMSMGGMDGEGAFSIQIGGVGLAPDKK